MAENSAISWTDATVNFWWGCTKVGPGCEHCYAEAWAKRTGASIWGHGAQRRKIKSAATLIHRLDNGYADWAADYECIKGNAMKFGLPAPTFGRTRRVFIQSMSDLFDLDVDFAWFAEAWSLIEACNRIDIQILTKRISAIEKRLAALGCKAWPKHAGLMITVVNQDEADRDVPRLETLKEKFETPWVGLSIEPMLAPMDVTPWIKHLDWVIVGGESGPHARPMHPDWARAIRDQCTAAGVPFHFKQWGEWAPMDAAGISTDGPVTDRWGNVRDWMSRYVVFDNDAGVARVLGHSFTEHATNLVYRVGKHRAGRLLDGVEHNGMPERSAR